MLRSGFQYYFRLIDGILGHCRILTKNGTLDPLFNAEALNTLQEKTEALNSTQCWGKSINLESVFVGEIACTKLLEFCNLKALIFSKFGQFRILQLKLWTLETLCLKL